MSAVSDSNQASAVGAANRPALSSESLAFGIVFALALTVIQRSLGGVRGLLFCRIMTDQELGQWSMVYSFLMMLAPLAVLGLPGSFGKFVEHYHQQGQLGSFLRKVGRFCFASTMAVAASIALFPRFYSQQVLGSDQHVGLMWLMAATMVLLTWLNYLTTLVEAMRQIRLVTIMRFISGVSFTGLGVLFLILFSTSSTAVLWSFLISCLFGIAPAWWFLRRRGAEIHDEGSALASRDLWRRLAPYAMWWWLSNLLHNLFEFADRYMLIHFCRDGYAAAQGLVGQYHSGRVIPLLMVGVAAMLSGLLLPYVAKSWSDGKLDQARSQMNWTIKLSTLGMMCANVMLLLLAPFVFDVLLDGRYEGGLAVFPMTMVYCTWFSIATVSQDFLWVSEKGKSAVAAMSAGLAVNLILNFILIPRLGLWGAVAGTAVGNVAMLIILLGANANYGCRPDRGCWAAVLLPLILLMPATNALLTFLVFLLGALFTSAIFSIEERRQLWELGQSTVNRLRGFST